MYKIANLHFAWFFPTNIKDFIINPDIFGEKSLKSLKNPIKSPTKNLKKKKINKYIFKYKKKEEETNSAVKTFPLVFQY